MPNYRISRTSVLLLTTTVSWLSSHALTVPSLSLSRQTLGPLHYRNIADNESDPDDQPQQASGSTRARVRARGLTVPVLGPIPGKEPLMMGGEMMLNPPTPLQWISLEESVAIHQKFKEEDANVTAIDAAPLVAVIDNVSGVSQDGVQGIGGSHGRYATLAAVVGISTSKKTKGVDTSSETSFMESIMQAGASKDMVLPLSSRIRLVGVGRALLRDFFYKLPSAVEEDDELVEDDNDEPDDDDDDDDDDRNVPIVMAEFDLLTDSSKTTSSHNDIGSKGARSRYMSPVHAIAEMSRMCNRVTYLHEDRRKLVAGLTAAKARLELASGRQDVYSDELIDYDGLGLLFGGEVEEEAQEVQMTIDEFLAKFEGKRDVDSDETPSPTGRLATLENFGLNYYSSFSSLPALSSESLNLFKPYYSRARRDTEEHEMEIMSFVAFRALDGFCTPEDKAWSLQCTNSVERLNRAYDIMGQHKSQLEQLAQEFSGKLRECGEECTDLW